MMNAATAISPAQDTTAPGTRELIIDHSCPAIRRAAYARTALEIRFALLARPGATLLVSAVDIAISAARLAANLAILAAQGGERVVLVDANPYAPSLQALFALPKHAGFADLVRGEPVGAPGQLVDAVPNLRVIGAGEGQLPAGRRYRAALAGALAPLKDGADQLILIGPPLMARADSLELCHFVDGMIVTLVPGVTSRLDAARVRDLLARVRAPLLGAILTRDHGA
ncbi:MAG TPA: hypothetical protein VNL71_18685 [Chloroflexota bacterium]|nr:hypothetical protein [Chloroflexota bacterium]